MKPLPIYLVFLGSVALAIPTMAQEIIIYEPCSIHMESAGGWVAAEKGFYGKVEVKEVQGERDQRYVQGWTFGQDAGCEEVLC